MKVQAMMLSALVLSGCGTVQTVMRDDQVAVDDLRSNKSYCGAVPRIYSGVMYDFCSLHAPIGQRNKYNAALPGWAIDAVASGVLDTLLLPYTVYKQQTEGSIVIN
jgi:uncharacterized protein YceK